MYTKKHLEALICQTSPFINFYCIVVCIYPTTLLPYSRGGGRQLLQLGNAADVIAFGSSFNLFLLRQVKMVQATDGGDNKSKDEASLKQQVLQLKGRKGVPVKYSAVYISQLSSSL
jgi:hypothetical protein